MITIKRKIIIKKKKHKPIKNFIMFKGKKQFQKNPTYGI